MSYVAALDHSGTCRGCGAVDKIDRWPGRFPRCFECGAFQLWMGKTRDAPCVSGSGRTDCHGDYVEGLGVLGAMSVCAFCKRPLSEALPEWPELDEEDLRFEPCQHDGPNGTHHGCWVTHVPTGIRVVAVTDKSMLKNKAAALRELRERLKSVGIGAYASRSL